MPRYEYRKLAPLPAAEKAFDSWLAWLDEQFANKDVNHRSEVVRNVLHDIYLGHPYADPGPNATLSEQAMVHSFDPRNTTLEPEYYGDVDPAKYAERKPLIWFWMMYDRSPLGLNHALGYRVRALIAKYVFKHIGNNVKIFHGVEVSYGYNLTIEDNCTIHKYVLLDDRGELIIHQGSSVSDYANIYSHDHDLNDGMIVENTRTEIGPKARITYHATVMSGVKVGEHGLVGSMGVATKDVPPYTIVAGVPTKPIKVKTIAPQEQK
ncbi:MAG: WcaF: colanic acid biosynthesis acetyltransferase [Acidobacteriales bacterium]|nr:WcaF: colanic acid biosynthesis acetyltransferase [Terriglobales bacterium]